MQNLGTSSNHEIVSGVSLLESELNEPSGIFESADPNAVELTNREAVHILMSAINENKEALKMASLTEATVTPLHSARETSSRHQGERVSQFISNLIPDYQAPSPEVFRPINGDSQNRTPQDGTAA